MSLPIVVVLCGIGAALLAFDEGPVFAETYDYLSARGIEFVHGVQRAAAREVFALYASSGGEIYNG